jgi:hypothetical protein
LPANPDGAEALFFLGLPPPVFLSMHKVVEVDDDVDVVKAPGANAKASQEGTFDDTNRSKTVAVAVATLITELLLLEKDFIT